MTADMRLSLKHTPDLVSVATEGAKSGADLVYTDLRPPFSMAGGDKPLSVWLLGKPYSGQDELVGDIYMHNFGFHICY